MALIDGFSEQVHAPAMISHDMQRLTVELLTFCSRKMDIGFGAAEFFLLFVYLALELGRPNSKPLLLSPFDHGVVTRAPREPFEGRNQRLLVKSPQHVSCMQLELVHFAVERISLLEVSDPLRECEPSPDMNGHADHHIVARFGGVSIRYA